MKKFIALGLFVNAVLLAGRLWQGLPVRAQGDVRDIVNGDTDGDGMINITDAVYLLNWLFQGGPAPVSIACDETPLDCLNADDRFQDQADGTFEDVCTGLQWKTEPVPGEFSREAADEFIRFYSLAGHDDWRLPTLNEIATIMPRLESSVWTRDGSGEFPIIVEYGTLTCDGDLVGPCILGRARQCIRVVVSFVDDTVGILPVRDAE